MRILRSSYYGIKIGLPFFLNFDCRSVNKRVNESENFRYADYYVNDVAGRFFVGFFLL